MELVCKYMTRSGGPICLFKSARKILSEVSADDHFHMTDKKPLFHWSLAAHLWNVRPFALLVLHDNPTAFSQFIAEVPMPGPMKDDQKKRWKKRKTRSFTLLVKDMHKCRNACPCMMDILGYVNQ